MMVAPIVFLDPNMMAGILLYAFAGALLGGIDSLPGALLGGFTLGIVEHVAAGLLSPGWDQGIGFFILLLVLVVRPQGLLGRAARRA